jgi:hypothetical protein
MIPEDRSLFIWVAEQGYDMSRFGRVFAIDPSCSVYFPGMPGLVLKSEFNGRDGEVIFRVTMEAKAVFYDLVGTQDLQIPESVVALFRTPAWRRRPVEE